MTSSAIYRKQYDNWNWTVLLAGILIHKGYVYDKNKPSRQGRFTELIMDRPNDKWRNEIFNIINSNNSNLGKQKSSVSISIAVT